MLDAKGGFEIRNVSPDQYTFALWSRSGKNAPYYLKRVECSGRDYAAQPVELSLGLRLDCDVTVGEDAATVTGRVGDGGAAVPGWVVAAIPQQPELRRLPRYTLAATTDREGKFQIAGLVPGAYYLFAVPPSEDQGYFALDFAERHLTEATRVSLKPFDTLAVELQRLNR